MEYRKEGRNEYMNNLGSQPKQISNIFIIMLFLKSRKIRVYKSKAFQYYIK